jgi:hypothetical protein
MFSKAVCITTAALFLGLPAIAQDAKKEGAPTSAAPEDKSEKYQQMFKMRDQSSDNVVDSKYNLSIGVGSSSIIADTATSSLSSQVHDTWVQLQLTYQMWNNLSLGGFIAFASYGENDFFVPTNAANDSKVDAVPFGFQASYGMGPYFYIGGTTGFMFFNFDKDTNFDILLGPHLGFRTQFGSGISVGAETQALFTTSSPDFIFGNLLLTVGYWL